MFEFEVRVSLVLKKLPTNESKVKNMKNPQTTKNKSTNPQKNKKYKGNKCIT